LWKCRQLYLSDWGVWRSGRKKQKTLIEEDRAALRDLITDSRTVIEAQKQTDAMVQALAQKLESLTQDIKALRDQVREHKGRIKALIDTVDRIIRRDQPPS
jgi:hypothetical protein